MLQRLALLAYIPGMIPLVYLVGRETRAVLVVGAYFRLSQVATDPPPDQEES